MSEYQEKFTSSRLFGAPPGYVGYEEGGQLTERVRRRPYSVVLFDEIEKAHPDVFNILLQVLDDGVLTDSLGRKVDFKNMRHHHDLQYRHQDDPERGSRWDSRARKASRSATRRKKCWANCAARFSPEFLNRIDEIVVFHQLDKTHLYNILDILLA